MPYISQRDRRPNDATQATAQEVREQCRSLLRLDGPGELNYAITSIIDDWLKRKGVRYASINLAIGVLECAKLELYRRVAAPYEDKKMEENGDVYECLIT